MDWKTFQKYFCDPDMPDCISRINTILSYCMMRRTMNSSILGRPIITLPTPHPSIEQVEFSPAEKIIYRITENRFRANLNKCFKQGDAARNYGFFMVQLLRLRQLTSHPWLIERTMRECWNYEDVQELRTRLDQLQQQSRGSFYEQANIWIRETALDRQAAIDKGEEPLHSIPYGKGDFGKAFQMDRALDTLDEQEMMDRITCGKCGDYPQGIVQTDVSTL